jgi:hypothetical protein
MNLFSFDPSDRLKLIICQVRSRNQFRLQHLPSSVPCLFVSVQAVATSRDTLSGPIGLLGETNFIIIDRCLTFEIYIGIFMVMDNPGWTPKKVGRSPENQCISVGLFKKEHITYTV